MSKTEDKLIERIKKGDFRAVAELVARYEKRIYNHALCMLADADEAEKVLQDTFLNVYKDIAKYNSKDEFDKWLFKVAISNCLVRQMKGKRAQPAVNLYEPLSLEDNSIKLEAADWSLRLDSARLGGSELRSFINKIMSELPGECRSVVLLRDVEGFSNNDVTHILNLSLPSVKSHLHMARFFIRGKLCKYLEN